MLFWCWQSHLRAAPTKGRGSVWHGPRGWVGSPQEQVLHRFPLQPFQPGQHCSCSCAAALLGQTDLRQPVAQAYARCDAGWVNPVVNSRRIPRTFAPTRTRTLLSHPPSRSTASCAPAAQAASAQRSTRLDFPATAPVRSGCHPRASGRPKIVAAVVQVLRPHPSCLPTSKRYQSFHRGPIRCPRLHRLGVICQPDSHICTQGAFADQRPVLVH